VSDLVREIITEYLHRSQSDTPRVTRQKKSQERERPVQRS
jgi:hypothetical protein